MSFSIREKLNKISVSSACPVECLSGEMVHFLENLALKAYGKKTGANRKIGKIKMEII